SHPFRPPAIPSIYSLSLHDALPISGGRRTSRSWLVGFAGERILAHAEDGVREREGRRRAVERGRVRESPRDDLARDVIPARASEDRKSTRLNSSHVSISYAVFCLKK